MKVYIVTREWKYRQACSYGDHGTYYETETDVVGAYDTEEKAKKKIEELEKENTFDPEDVRYWWEECEVE